MSQHLARPITQGDIDDAVALLEAEGNPVAELVLDLCTVCSDCERLERFCPQHQRYADDYAPGE